jgi:hypothetical protein
MNVTRPSQPIFAFALTSGSLLLATAGVLRGTSGMDFEYALLPPRTVSEGVR